MHGCSACACSWHVLDFFNLKYRYHPSVKHNSVCEICSCGWPFQNVFLTIQGRNTTLYNMAVGVGLFVFMFNQFSYSSLQLLQRTRAYPLPVRLSLGSLELALAATVHVSEWIVRVLYNCSEFSSFWRLLIVPMWLQWFNIQVNIQYVNIKL